MLVCFAFMFAHMYACMRVEENLIYHIVKPNSKVNVRTVYKGCMLPKFYGK